jgi:hypothetical protein
MPESWVLHSDSIILRFYGEGVMYVHTPFLKHSTLYPGANPTPLSYNASAVNVYNAMSSLLL